jgi:hypothetical protein
VNRGLLVANEDVSDGVLLEQCVIDRQDSTAGIAEDDLDALFLQRTEDDFSARALIPYPADLTYSRLCTPASEDGLKESPKHVK